MRSACNSRKASYNITYFLDAEASSNDTDIYKNLQQKNSREILHYTVFESNRVQWNKVMNFQEPTVRIFCPNLTALRDTFRSVITVRLIYTLVSISRFITIVANCALRFFPRVSIINVSRSISIKKNMLLYRNLNDNVPSAISGTRRLTHFLCNETA